MRPGWEQLAIRNVVRVRHTAAVPVYLKGRRSQESREDMQGQHLHIVACAHLLGVYAVICTELLLLSLFTQQPGS